MSFYSADALPRAVTDLEGVLCAGGVLTSFGRGTAARLAIVLGAPPEVTEGPDDDEGAPVRDRPPAPPAGPNPDHRAPWPPPGRPEPPPVRGDHERGWEEGVDEIPDDEFPVRDDGATEPEHEAPEHPDAPRRTPSTRATPTRRRTTPTRPDPPS